MIADKTADKRRVGVDHILGGQTVDSRKKLQSKYEHPCCIRGHSNTSSKIPCCAGRGSILISATDQPFYQARSSGVSSQPGLLMPTGS